MLDPSTVTVLIGKDARVRETARSLAAALQDEAPRVRGEDDNFGNAPLLAIGLDADVERWLKNRGFPARPPALSNGTAVTWTAMLASGQVLTVVSARDVESLAALARPLPHYGRRSYVVFEGAKMIDAGVWPAKARVWPLH
jgi:hypothetical protein